MGMGFAPTWLCQVSPPPCFTKPLTTGCMYVGGCLESGCVPLVGNGMTWN